MECEKCGSSDIILTWMETRVRTDYETDTQYEDIITHYKCKDCEYEFEIIVE